MSPFCQIILGMTDWFRDALDQLKKLLLDGWTGLVGILLLFTPSVATYWAATGLGASSNAAWITAVLLFVPWPFLLLKWGKEGSRLDRMLKKITKNR